jgi:hypothetical protein
MRQPIDKTASTGQSCLERRVWKVVSSPTTTEAIAKVNMMLPYGWQGFTWRLEVYT